MAVLGMELNAQLTPGFSLSMQAGAGGVKDLVWTRDQIGWRMLRTANGNKVYPAYSTYYLDIAGTAVDATLLAHIRLNASSPWSLTLGGGMVWPLTLDYDQYEVVDGDAASILSDSRRPQRDVSAGTISSSAASYARVAMGLRHEHLISPRIRLVYDVTANLALTPLLTSGSGAFSRHALRASVGLLFDLAGVVDSVSVVAEIQPAAPAPEAVVAITDTSPVVQEPEPPVVVAVTPPLAVAEPDPVPKPEPESVSEPAVPDRKVRYLDLTSAYQLLPYIFFVPGTVEIDERCHESKPFQNVEILFDTANTQDTYTRRHELLHRHLLDVIGYRMSRMYPESHLVINGYINGRASDSLVMKYGYARALRIAQYLQKHWGIEAGRLQTSSPEGMSPTACTYALRDVSDILDAEEENTRCEISSPDEPRLMAAVKATVRAAEHDLGGADQSTIVRLLSLPVLDAAEAVSATAPPVSGVVTSVMVTGYTDRKGPQSINQRISEQRARKAASLIDARPGTLTIDWIGEGARGMRAPYTNDTPLGRLLNRCAEVRRVWVSYQR